MQYIWLYLAACFLSISLWGVEVHAGFRCINNCSGHGRCSNDDVCHCNPGWDAGMFPDCSLRSCARGPAWSGKPTADDEAHSIAECSNVGVCNRRSGLCECTPGFTGAACERMNCIDNCSGHGNCMSVGEQYKQFNTENDRSLTYDLWDSVKSAGCVCDVGYTGGKCEYRLCPRGSDPINKANEYYTIILRTSAVSGALGGKLKFTYDGKSFFFSPDVTVWTNAECKKSFESLPSIKTVECSNNGTDYTGGGTAYTVKITAWPSVPHFNNVYGHRGQPSLNAFHCDASAATSATGASTKVQCNIGEVNSIDLITAQGALAVLPTYEPCSNRGICDMMTGTCSCKLNFFGSNCDTFIPEGVVQNLVDVMSITVTNPAFDQSVLHLADTVRAKKGHWTSIVMENNFNVHDNLRDTLFNMSAGGDITLKHGKIIISGPNDGNTGLYIYQSGLMIHNGGMTIASDGLEIVPVGDMPSDLHVDNSSIAGGISIDARITVNRTGVVVNEGGMTIHTGGMIVPDCTYSLGDLGIFYHVPTYYTPRLNLPLGWVYRMCPDARGLYVGTGGVRIVKGGVRAYGGVNVVGGFVMIEPHVGGSTKGVTIMTGGLDVRQGGMTVNEIGFTVARGMTIVDGGLDITGSTTVKGEYGMRVKDGAAIVNGADVDRAIIDESHVVARGGMSINAGGMIFLGLGGPTHPKYNEVGITVGTGGIAIHAGGLKVSGGMNIEDTGVTVTVTGVTMKSGGITITKGGLTVNAGGAVVGNTAGVPVPVDIIGGLAIDGGLRYTSSMEPRPQSGGYTIMNVIDLDGGLTIEDVGFTVSGGVEIGTLGYLHGPIGYPNRLGINMIAGGVTVKTAGMIVKAQGVELKDIGLNMTGGVFVQLDGMKINGGVSLNDKGLVVNRALYSSYTALVVKEGGVDVDVGVVQVLSTRGGVAVNEGIISVENGFSVHIPPAHVGIGQNQIASQGISVGTGLVKVKTGGVRISKGGIQILSDGLTLDSPWAFQEGGIFDAHRIRTGGLTVNGNCDIEDGMRIKADPRHTNAGGSHNVIDDGASITGGVKLLQPDSNNKITVSGGMEVTGGLKIRPSLNVESFIRTGGLKVTGGLSVKQGGMKVTEQAVVDEGGVNFDALTVIGGISTDAVELRSAPKIAMTRRRNIRATGRLLIFTGGLKITAPDNVALRSYQDGFEVMADGGTVKGGIRIGGEGQAIRAAGGPRAFDGLSSRNLGLSVVDGITVNSEGMTVWGGLQIIGGLIVDKYIPIPRYNYANVRLKHSMMITAGGMSVNEGGLRVRGELLSSSADIGVAVKGTGYVQKDGLVISANGMSIKDSGMLAKGKIAVGDIGINFSEKVHIGTEGVVVNAGGMQVEDNGGLKMYVNQLLNTIDIPKGDPMAGHTRLRNASDGIYENIAMAATTGSGTGALARVHVIEGYIDSITITVAGTGYATGDIIKIPNNVLCGDVGAHIVTTADALLTSITTTPNNCAGGVYSPVWLRNIGGSGEHGYATITVDGTGEMVTTADALLSSIDGNPADADDGTYTNVALTGGTGTSAKATIIVLGNKITSMTMTTAGTGYAVGDQLTVPEDFDGGTCAPRTLILLADDFGSQLVTAADALLPSIGGNSATDAIDGTYTAIELRGGSGSGAIATIVVASNVISSITVTTAGDGYRIGDVLYLHEGFDGWHIGRVNHGTTFTLVANDLVLATELSKNTDALLPSIKTNPADAADGTYTAVSLIGGSGSGAKATVVVASGVISSITITTGGTGYLATDVVTISEDFDGSTSGRLEATALSLGNVFITETGACDISSITAIQGGGQGYAVGDLITIAPHTLGEDSTGWTLTLVADDIAGGGAWSHWCEGRSFTLEATDFFVGAWVESKITVNAGNVNVNGNLQIIGGTIKHTGSLTVSSDRRLKENIAYMTAKEGSDMISKLRGVYFDWDPSHKQGNQLASELSSQRTNSSYADLTSRRVGFIAQELQLVLPHIVQSIPSSFSNETTTPVDKTEGTRTGTETESAPPLLGIAYQDVIPYLVMSVQHAEQRTQALFAAQEKARKQRESLNESTSVIETPSMALANALQQLEASLRTTEARRAKLVREVQAFSNAMAAAPNAHTNA